MNDGHFTNPQECIKIAFDNGYQYAGLSDGGLCWGSNDKIGKYGESSKCNYLCPNGEDTCGGLFAITAYKLDYGKDRFCGINQKFDEINADGTTNWGNGGVMTNPSGDGEYFTWTPRIEGDSFNMVAVRSKSGVIKGFKLFEDNPFYQDIKFLSWNERESTLEANGVTYKAVKKYGEEDLTPYEEFVAGRGWYDDEEGTPTFEWDYYVTIYPVAVGGVYSEG